MSATIRSEWDTEFLRQQAIPLRQVITADAIFVVRMSDEDMAAWNEGRYNDVSGDVWISWIPMGQSGAVHATVDVVREKFQEIWARLKGRQAESLQPGFANVPPVIGPRREPRRPYPRTPNPTPCPECGGECRTVGIPVEDRDGCQTDQIDTVSECRSCGDKNH